MRLRKKYRISYIPPGKRSPIEIMLGRREAELISALRYRDCTRMDLLFMARPRTAMNATSMVSHLRRKGFSIGGKWEIGRDADGARTRHMRYSLEGRIQ